MDLDPTVPNPPGSRLRRAGALLALVFAALVVPAVARVGVAQACACGAFDPARGGTADVSQETALVRTSGVADSGTFAEDIYLSLTLDSDVRTGALLFPVPDRHPVVSAGPRNLFADLDTLTEPPLTSGSASGGGNGAGSGVIVEKRQAIGPLDVVTLEADDAGALTTWLTTHGFAAKPAVATGAAAYVREHWSFIAVRLRPAAAASTLRGQLDPLRISFRTSRLVYPMRLSHVAAEPDPVTVYTLAPHSLKLVTRDPGMQLVWARRLTDGDPESLAGLTRGGATFLTRYNGTLAPETIDDDFHFTVDPTDPTTRPRQVDNALDVPPQFTPHDPFGADSSTPVAAWTSGGVAAALVVVVGIVIIRRRRNPTAPR